MMAVGLLSLLFAGKEAKGQGRIVPDKPVDYQLWKNCFDDDDYWGASYNYNNCCKAGFSMWLTFGNYFMIEGSIGINCDKEKYFYSSKDEKKYLSNSKQSSLNPWFDVCLTPSFHTNILSIGCGIGTLCSGDEKLIYDETYKTFNINDVSGTTRNAFHLVIKPTFKINIPLTKDNHVVLETAYNYIFGPVNELSGMQFSIGFERTL